MNKILPTGGMYRLRLPLTAEAQALLFSDRPMKEVIPELVRRGFLVPAIWAGDPSSDFSDFGAQEPSERAAPAAPAQPVQGTKSASADRIKWEG